MEHKQPGEAVPSVIFNHLQGNSSEEEERLLEAWRGQSAENEGIYQEFTRLHQCFPEDEPEQGLDLAAGWSDLSRRLGLEEARVVRLKPKRSPLPYVVLAAAAALLLFFFFPRAQSDLIRILVPEGETQTATLPDGSVVELNGDSVLAYTPHFSGQLREVSLRGQAFFTVVKDQKPFVVRTATAKVRVLGTRFDVWARNEHTRVFVVSGLVGVSRHESEDGETLRANQQIEIGPEISGKAGPGDPARLTAWREGRLVFDKQPLAAVALDLSAHFAVSVTLAPQLDPQQRFSAVYDGEGIETILDELCLSLGLTWEKRENAFVLLPNGV